MTNVSWDDAKVEFVAWLSQRRQESPIGFQPRLSGNMRREAGRRLILVGKGRRDGTRPVRRMRGSEGTAGRHPRARSGPNAFPDCTTPRGDAAEWSGGLLESNVPRARPTQRSGLDELAIARFAFSGEARLLTRRSLCAPRRVFRYDEDVRYYANGFRVARDLD